VVGVDPAFGGDAETGIILAAVTTAQTYVVLEDLSGNHKPEAWLDIVKNLALKFNATISVEVNHGGNLVADLLKGFPVVEQRAYVNKYSRSMPCYLMYHQKQVFHAKKFPLLEEQMCNFENSKKDRVDALVWALHYLRNRYTKTYSSFEIF